jgi:hypothetical protein
MNKLKVNPNKDYFIRNRKNLDKFGIVHVVSVGFLGDGSITITTDDKASLKMDEIANQYIGVHISNWTWEEVKD